MIAFVKDPDGYTFGLIQRPTVHDPFCQIMLRVGDLERAINFYEKVTLQFFFLFLWFEFLLSFITRRSANCIVVNCDLQFVANSNH